MSGGTVDLKVPDFQLSNLSNILHLIRAGSKSGLNVFVILPSAAF